MTQTLQTQAILFHGCRKDAQYALWISAKISMACASGQVENLRDAVHDRLSGFLTRFFLKGSETADRRHCMQIRYSATN